MFSVFSVCLLKTSDTMEMSHTLYFTGKDRMVTGQQCKYLTMTFPHVDLIVFHLIHPHIRNRKFSNED